MERTRNSEPSVTQTGGVAAEFRGCYISPQNWFAVEGNEWEFTRNEIFPEGLEIVVLKGSGVANPLARKIGSIHA
jgi:hypothetical protein